MTTIRRLQAEEIEAFVDELWVPFAEEMAAMDSYNALASDVRADAIAYRHERLEAEDVAIFVAVADGTRIGYASVELEEPPPVFERDTHANIGELYVIPAHRRSGVGATLMDAAEEWARTRGATRATLSVNARNEAAIDLYESRGYRIRRHKMDRPLE